MNFRPLCIVRTPDDGIRFFEAHDPVRAIAGAPITVNLKLENPLGNDFAVLRICGRCGVVYLDSHATKVNVQPTPAGTTPS